MGLCGVIRIWIKNYSMIICPLTEIWRKEESFLWNNRREQVFQTLKKLVSTAPALYPIDYDFSNPVMLAVDSSYMEVSIILSQIDEESKKYPACYRSIPFNNREANYSQLKLELYRLFHVLRAFRQYLYGTKNL